MRNYDGTDFCRALMQPGTFVGLLQPMDQSREIGAFRWYLSNGVQIRPDDPPGRSLQGAWNFSPLRVRILTSACDCAADSGIP